MDFYITVLLIWFTAGFVNNLTGFGAAMVAIPIMAFFGLDMKVAAPAALVIACLLNMQLCWDCRRHIDFARVWPVLIGLVPGAFLGTFLLSRVDGHTLRIAVGSVIIVYSLWGLFLEGRLALVISRFWGVPLGLASSFLGATVAFPGPPLVLYATFSGWPKDSIKGGLTVFFILSTALAVGAQVIDGNIHSMKTLEMALVGIPGSLAGGMLGIRLSRYVSENSFRKMIYTVFLLMGVSLLV